MPRLNVNIDHVATLRQARKGVIPDPVHAAALAELGGADGIVVHLRGDRRHIQEQDVKNLRNSIKTKLNLEMAPTKEMIKIALAVKPNIITVVPEKAGELTTQGGYNVSANIKELTELCSNAKNSKIIVSMFIDPDIVQVKASQNAGAVAIEINTLKYAACKTSNAIEEELEKIQKVASFGKNIGLEVYAGHDINLKNIKNLLGISEIIEYNIGHSIIARAIYIGLENAVREMKELIA